MSKTNPPEAGGSEIAGVVPPLRPLGPVVVRGVLSGLLLSALLGHGLEFLQLIAWVANTSIALFIIGFAPMEILCLFLARENPLRQGWDGIVTRVLAPPPSSVGAP